jgi:hypothetical protein
MIIQTEKIKNIYLRSDGKVILSLIIPTIYIFKWYTMLQLCCYSIIQQLMSIFNTSPPWTICLYLENRFTGTRYRSYPFGEEEADGQEKLKDYKFEIAYTSMLIRAKACESF